jgi:predicted dehydrogenase
MQKKDPLMKKVRLGIIGATGFASIRPMPGLQAAKNCVLEAIHGRPEREDDLRQLADQYNVSSVYTDIGQLLADPRVDAVYIATPVDLHKQHTIEAARAGKHVLLEKPMALTVRDCRQMISACEKSGVKLQVGYMRRFHPHHAKIKQIIDRGSLGEIVEARVQTHLWYPRQKGAWRQLPARGGGGAFMDVGSHCLELLEYFLGPVKWVQGFAENVVFDYKVEDLCLAVVKFASKAVGIIDASFAIAHRQNPIEIYGVKGALLAQRTAGPFADPELVLLDDRGAKAVAVGANKDQYQGEFEHFADAILNDKQPEVDGRAGLRNLKQVLAVYRSMKERRRVRVA